MYPVWLLANIHKMSETKVFSCAIDDASIMHKYFQLHLEKMTWKTLLGKGELGCHLGHKHTCPYCQNFSLKVVFKGQFLLLTTSSLTSLILTLTKVAWHRSLSINGPCIGDGKSMRSVLCFGSILIIWISHVCNSHAPFPFNMRI